MVLCVCRRAKGFLQISKTSGRSMWDSRMQVHLAWPFSRHHPATLSMQRSSFDTMSAPPLLRSQRSCSSKLIALTLWSTRRACVCSCACVALFSRLKRWIRMKLCGRSCVTRLPQRAHRPAFSGPLLLRPALSRPFSELDKGRHDENQQQEGGKDEIEPIVEPLGCAAFPPSSPFSSSSSSGFSPPARVVWGEALAADQAADRGAERGKTSNRVYQAPGQNFPKKCITS